jgi:hypothetical protein
VNDSPCFTKTSRKNAHSLNTDLTLHPKIRSPLLKDGGEENGVTSRINKPMDNHGLEEYLATKGVKRLGIHTSPIPRPPPTP